MKSPERNRKVSPMSWLIVLPMSLLRAVTGFLVKPKPANQYLTTADLGRLFPHRLSPSLRIRESYEMTGGPEAPLLFQTRL